MIQSFEDINLEDDIKNSFSNYIIKNFSNLKIFIREWKFELNLILSSIFTIFH